MPRYLDGVNQCFGRLVFVKEQVYASAQDNLLYSNFINCNVYKICEYNNLIINIKLTTTQVTTSTKAKCIAIVHANRLRFL